MLVGTSSASTAGSMKQHFESDSAAVIEMVAVGMPTRRTQQRAVPAVFAKEQQMEVQVQAVRELQSLQGFVLMAEGR